MLTVEVTNSLDLWSTRQYAIRVSITASGEQCDFVRWIQKRVIATPPNPRHL